MKSWNTKFCEYIAQLQLFTIVIIPVSTSEQFVQLNYNKIKPNIVEIGKFVSIGVNKTASPLFYRFDEPKIAKSILVEGNVSISQPIKDEKDDTYFQLGIIYEGIYRPGYLMRQILPEWLLKIIDLNKKYGVGEVSFYHVTNIGKDIKKTSSVRSIKLNFQTATHLDKGKFKFTVPLKDNKILGLWLRADGDNHQGEFKTTITSLNLLEN